MIQLLLVLFVYLQTNILQLFIEQIYNWFWVELLCRFIFLYLFKCGFTKEFGIQIFTMTNIYTKYCMYINESCGD